MNQWLTNAGDDRPERAQRMRQGLRYAPRTGWRRSHEIDLGAARAICDWCEIQRIRYAVVMTHPKWQELRVGRICALKMNVLGWTSSGAGRDQSPPKGVVINDPPRLRAIRAGLQRAWRVSAVDLVKIRQLGERALGGEHIWAYIFWALIIVAILAFYAWR
jgi:hypothetical protein